jgi:beta-phosphoglucomutase-like phosphatase (HAD superfamily)
MKSAKAKNSAAVSVIFFDLGATLVDPVLKPDGTLKAFNPLPGAREALQALRKAGLKLGIISDTGDIPLAAVRKALTGAKLSQFFAKKLVLLSGAVHLDKSTPAIFRLAIDRASAADPRKCMFVGDDPGERRMARSAGMRTSRTAEAALRVLSGKKPYEQPTLAGMKPCIEDARDAVQDTTAGPPEPRDYNKLLERLEAAKTSLPPLYRSHCADPFLRHLHELGERDFGRVIKRDPKREREAGLMFDIAQAILQNGEEFEKLATDAFEEVVSDLYDGFLSAEDRAGIKLPDNRVLAPLVKWGEPDSGPYTWPIDSTETFDVDAAIVNLPPANARIGLMAWTSLSHEAAGHDILHADEGLEAEYKQKLSAALRAAKVGAGLDEYWSERIDETASDVMGILNMGPAAGIGVIAFFRGWNATQGEAKLSNVGDQDDPHPADILRGFVAASTVRLLSFAGAPDWADLIERETEKDVTQIKIGRIPLSIERAKQSCEIVANTLAASRMKALNQHALIDIQNWRDEDEAIVQALQSALLTGAPISASHETGIYAAHVVAAAALAALAGKAKVPTVFKRMLDVLKRMHDANAAWGPLFVAHPGDIARDFFRLRRKAA